MDLDSKRCGWEIRVAHGSSNLDCRKLRRNDDKEMLLIKDSGAQLFDGHQSRLICLTTKGSYGKHVKEEMSTISYPPKEVGKRKAPPPKKVYDTIAWGRMIIDESHMERGANSKGIVLARTLTIDTKREPVRKWMLSGTPFESAPIEMAQWIKTLEDNICSWKSVRPTGTWPDLDKWRANLKYCTFGALKDMSKIHERLVKKGKSDPKEVEDYIHKLTVVLSTLWIRRSAESSTFFGQPLVELPANTHQVIHVKFPPHIENTGNSVAGAIAARLKAHNDRTTVEWTQRGQVGPMPQISLTNWMLECRRLRIISSFPALGEIDATKSLDLTGQELVKQNWLRIKRGHLYDLEAMHSPFELHINEITCWKNCPKLQAIKRLINVEWEPNEKALFCTMGPTNAFILYWVCIESSALTTIYLVSKGANRTTVAEKSRKRASRSDP